MLKSLDVEDNSGNKIRKLTMEYQDVNPDKLTDEQIAYCENDVKGLYSVCTGELDYKYKEEVLYIISVRSFLSKLNGGKLDVKEINANVARMLEEAIEDDELIQIGTVQKSNAFSLLNDEIIAKLSKMKSKNFSFPFLSGLFLVFYYILILTK